MSIDLDAEPNFASMTREEREDRVRALSEDAERIVEQALNIHLDGRSLQATCVLFSGGNDSTVLAHLMRPRATHAIHCNTTIGIEETRQFVRDVCASWELPLIEEVAPVSYRQLVLEHGFPGPGHHWKMYQRLKERGLRQARRKLVSNPRSERVLFLAGRRRAESARRSDIPEHERDGSIIWASPLVRWHKLDLATYRTMAGDVPRNEVSDILHMSGECLCGAFAKPGELEDIREWFPAVAEEIDALQEEVLATGLHPGRCHWGNRKGKATRKTGAMCSSCDSRFDPTADQENAP